VTYDFHKYYVMAKLTLHVPEELVAAAKREAVKRQVSVSKLVSDYFTILTTERGSGEDSLVDLAPRTRRLAGCLPEADFEDYVDYLERKHS